MEQNIKRLESIAQAAGLSVSRTEIVRDQNIFEMILKNSEIDLHILFIEEDGMQYAYDISSGLLPRELYPDSPKAPISIQDRNNEILNNIESILKRQFTFYKKPSFLNSRKGYFEMPIDGQRIKIIQKNNYFGLPVEN